MIGGTSSGGAVVREQIQIARSLTDRPFGVGFISCFPEIDELVDIAIEERVFAINHSFADPAPFVRHSPRAGILIFAMVQTVSVAEHAAASGVDVVIAQGGEAGGHGGNLGTFALLPSVVDAVAKLPVIAAGGIADGRGLAAASAAGCAGCWMGTRFVASEEWGGRAFKQTAVDRPPRPTTPPRPTFTMHLGRALSARDHAPGPAQRLTDRMRAAKNRRLPTDELNSRTEQTKARRRRKIDKSPVSAPAWPPGWCTRLCQLERSCAALSLNAEAVLRERPAESGVDVGTLMV